MASVVGATGPKGPSDVDSRIRKHCAVSRVPRQHRRPLPLHDAALRTKGVCGISQPCDAFALAGSRDGAGETEEAAKRVGWWQRSARLRIRFMDKALNDSKHHAQSQFGYRRADPPC